MKWKHITLLLTVALAVFLFSACQHDPRENVIVNKNDGSFDASTAISADGSVASNATTALEYMEEFLSTDSSVTFQMNLNATVSNRNMPIVEVSPHYLTEADAQRVAEALFGDVQFYEKDQVLSKDEIQQCIDRWVPFLNREAMQGLLSTSDDTYIEWRLDLLKRNIEAYTEAYEYAPAENPHIPCPWVYHKDSYYSLSSAQYSETEHSEDNNSIQATTTVNNIPYSFYASVRNNSDYKLSSVFAFPLENTVGDKAIYIAQVCRTEKPTDEQIEGIKEKAEAILNQIQIGEWVVDEYYLETTAMDEYIIHVNAVPKLCGVSALRLPQLSNLKSDKTFSSNYYLTNVCFEFSPSGDLLFFELQSPLDISNIVNSNVAVLDLSVLLEHAKQTLSLSDIYTYDFNSIVDICKEQNIELECIVAIDELEYNLIRVKKPNTDESYYYVPGILLSGNIEYYNKTTGDLLCEREQSQLLAMNAIDGSVIQLSNE